MAGRAEFDVGTCVNPEQPVISRDACAVQLYGECDKCTLTCQANICLAVEVMVSSLTA